MGKLSPEEQRFLGDFIKTTEAEELAQVAELINECKISFQFAKTHSVYVKDWERTRAKMEKSIKAGVLPRGTSRELMEEMITAHDDIIKRKLKTVQKAFEEKFGESIFNYLGPDGKVKPVRPIWIILLLVAGMIIFFITR